MIRHLVKEGENNLRLDKWVSVLLSDISRSFISKNVKDFVLVDGKNVKPSYRLKQGQKVEINSRGIKKKYAEYLEMEDLESKIFPQKSSLNIVCEDTNYIVLIKPPGLVVHPGIGHRENTLANYVKNYLMEKGEYDIELSRAGIVHRLDKPVSGLIVFAKNRKFQKYLSEQFEKHEVLKIYYAQYHVLGGQKIFNNFERVDAVYDVIEKYKKDLDLNLEKWLEVSGTMKRDPSNRKRMLFQRNMDNERLRYAQSYLLPLSEKRMCVLIKTGRMHQIRGTLRSLGVVLKGDKLYGYKGEETQEIGLSSVVLGFTDMDGEKKVFNILNSING